MDQAKKQAVFGTLLELARSDGEISPLEHCFFQDMLTDWQLPLGLVDQLLAGDTPMGIEIPDSAEDRMAFFEQVIRLAFADGVLLHQEVMVITDIAARCHIDPATVQRMIAEASRVNAAGRAAEPVMAPTAPPEPVTAARGFQPILLISVLVLLTVALLVATT